MALLDTESFGEWANFGNIANAQPLFVAPFNGTVRTNSAPLFGTDHACQTNSGTVGHIIKQLKSAATTFFCGMRVNLGGNAGAAASYMDFRSTAGTVQFSVAFYPGQGTLVVYQGAPTATVLGTIVPGILPYQSWFYVEVGAVMSTSVGSIAVRVNGVQVFSATGINNSPDSANVNVAQYGYSGATTSGFEATHWYFCDNTGSAPYNTYLGDVRVQTLLPTANSAVQFAPVGLATNALNAANVPAVPASDFNASATVGQIDLFAMAAPSATATTVLALTTKNTWAASDNLGRSMASQIKSGASTFTGASTAVSTTVAMVQDISLTDPATGVAWTVSGVTAALGGYKIAA